MSAIMLSAEPPATKFAMPLEPHVACSPAPRCQWLRTASAAPRPHRSSRLQWSTLEHTGVFEQTRVNAWHLQQAGLHHWSILRPVQLHHTGLDRLGHPWFKTLPRVPRTLWPQYLALHAPLKRAFAASTHQLQKRGRRSPPQPARRAVLPEKRGWIVGNHIQEAGQLRVGAKRGT